MELKREGHSDLTRQEGMAKWVPAIAESYTKTSNAAVEVRDYGIY